MFPSNLRGIASTFAVTVNWICVILVATFFPIIDVSFKNFNSSNKRQLLLNKKLKKFKLKLIKTFKNT